MSAPVVLVDAENVRRSLWPNLTPEELVRGVVEWAEREDVSVQIVFDGSAPAADVKSVDAVVVGSGGESADDWIARRAAELRSGGARFWLVTSDRELRLRAGAHADRLIGGGAFARGL
ncbi:MAG: hypothetical protein C5B48_08170 [Candidatus Rokuibacteriota bacterium]|nr:MAG: hypothetical protein C5B48_08170 [Candidatus Rokubacteria bacterium]